MDEFTFEGCERPKVQLVGMDGNAFSILGRCQAAAKKLWSEEQMKQFHDEATSGEYEDLIRTVAKYFDLIDPVDPDDEYIDYEEEYDEESDFHSNEDW